VPRIKDICNFAGLVTRIEEVRCFQEADPECNLRPDVSIYNFPYNNTALQGRKMILDVAVTHPIPILSNKSLSRNEALQPNRAANLYFQKKRNQIPYVEQSQQSRVFTDHFREHWQNASKD
jgi:hypothetical protein